MVVSNPSIEREIATLLLTHSCVPIPGMGYIKAKDQSATFDQVQGLLMPPGRSLSFEAQDKTDNQLLSLHLRRTFGMEAIEAEALIQRYAQVLAQKVNHQKGFVDIAGIGSLFRDEQGLLRFFPSKSAPSPATIGLPAVAIPAFVRVDQGKIPVVPVSHQWNSRTLGLLLLALGLALGGYKLWVQTRKVPVRTAVKVRVEASVAPNLSDEYRSALREVGAHDNDLFPMAVMNGHSDGIW